MRRRRSVAWSMRLSAESRIENGAWMDDGLRSKTKTARSLRSDAFGHLPILFLLSGFLLLPLSYGSNFSPCNGKALLGDACDKDSDCEHKGAICLRGSCQCHPFYVKMVSEKGNSARCVRLPATIGAECSSKCREPLFCRNGRCQCVQRGSTSIHNGECVSVSRVGDRCSRHYDCTSPFSACVNHMCVCISGTVQQGSRCVATSNCPLGGSAAGSCIRQASLAQISNFIENPDNCAQGYFCVTTPDSPIGHCCPKVCPLGSSVDNSYTCIPGASSHSSLHSNFSFIKTCPSETHFCHYLSGDTFSQAVCCKRPCNAMAPEALYLHGECMARGQLGAECQKHEQCGAAEGMECQMGLCRCAMGFNPAMDSLTNPVKNPSQQCVKGCDSTSLSRDTTCLQKTSLGGACFVQEQCPDNSGCYRGRCLCRCGYRMTASNRCVELPPPTTQPPPPVVQQPFVPGLVSGLSPNHGSDIINIINKFFGRSNINGQISQLPLSVQPTI
uniref:EB domain-containing protein n=1 Tax=Acrobeloides nanus TaxID=290746 RepID=A0A914BWS4_9BILA